MMLFIVIFLILIFLQLNKSIIRQGYKILNPVSTLLLVWSAVYIGHSIYFPDRSTTLLAYISTLVGLICTIIGFWSAYSKDTQFLIHSRVYNMKFLKTLLNVFILIDLLRLFYSTNLVVFNLAGGAWYMLWGEGTYLRNLYLDYNPAFYEKVFVFCSNLFCYIGYIILGIYVADKQKKSWMFFFLVTLIELAMSLVTMSKLSFTLYLVAFSITYLNKQRTVEEQKRKIMAVLPFALVVLVGFFFFIGFQRNYMETKGDLSSGVIDGIINYFAGPLEAFNVYLEKGPSVLTAEHGMVNIGRTETNVYTWYLYFIKGLSYLGLIIYPFILGYFAGKLYRPMRHNLFYDVANSWICVFFIFSFFDFLLKFTVYQVLFLFVWLINKRYYKRLYVYE